MISSKRRGGRGSINHSWKTPLSPKRAEVAPGTVRLWDGATSFPFRPPSWASPTTNHCSPAAFKAHVLLCSPGIDGKLPATGKFPDFLELLPRLPPPSRVPFSPHTSLWEEAIDRWLTFSLPITPRCPRSQCTPVRSRLASARLSRGSLLLAQNGGHRRGPRPAMTF